jgi:hypothetical protein
MCPASSASLECSASALSTYSVESPPSSWLAPSSWLTIGIVQDNPYEFITDQERNASAKYGAKSASLLAIKG